MKTFFFFFFFWRALALVSLVLGLGLEHSCPCPRECLSSERQSLALASDFFCVLGLGLGFFLCPWPWPRALCPRLHLWFGATTLPETPHMAAQTSIFERLKLRCLFFLYPQILNRQIFCTGISLWVPPMFPLIFCNL